MKLNTVSLCNDVTPHDLRAAKAMAIVGAALMEASNALLGKPTRTPAGLLTGPGEGCLITVHELVNEFLLAKARAGRGDRYLAQLRVVLKSFNQGRGRTCIDQITTRDLERWTENPAWASRTVRGYLSDVRTLFNFAVKRGYITRNPALGIEPRTPEAESEIHVHTPEQADKVLKYARRANLDVCRRLAIRYFAGVRSAEAGRLEEKDLKMEHGLIEVSAVKSKTRARRLVTIQPNLRAWLELGGELRPMSFKTVKTVLDGAGVPWFHNVTRHSFVSYHYAHFGSASRTAMEAGHSEAMLFKHYRALVSPQAAKEFWEIVP